MKTIEGTRIYGAWVGNPKGRLEDTALCIEEVLEPGWGGFFHQCGKRRGHGKGGLYCKIHDPEYVNAKRQAERDKWDKESAERTAKHKLQDTAVSACKAINPSNPQAVAQSITNMHEACKNLIAWDESHDDAVLISNACSLARQALNRLEERNVH
ncbi:hypothetical protein LCGC14_2392640 [marine sediment metagenome]|uniref:Uncharacterized protein n=1 Tax=marine sediment metagenome TaxID=412755 RepID=A0A0F9BXV3_9ZZZZ